MRKLKCELYSEFYYIYVSFLRCDDGTVIMKENVFILRRFRLKYLGVKRHDVESFYQIIHLKAKCVCVHVCLCGEREEGESKCGKMLTRMNPGKGHIVIHYMTFFNFSVGLKINVCVW